MFWHALPAEIQLQILETLILHGNTARYSSVCQAWQTFLEPKTFARLTVTRSRLVDFADIGYRHRHLVRYIWLSIEPPEYLCPRCGGSLLCSWHPVSTKSIRKAIQDLIVQLSTWEPSGSLILDVSVRASTELMDQFGAIQYGPGFLSESKEAETVCSYWLHDASFHSPAAYLLSRMTRMTYPDPELSLISRIITGVTDPKPKLRQRMPKARAVTSLLLRRQNRCPWKREVVEELLDLLPEVHEIHYEPWRDWQQMGEQSTITTTDMLRHSLRFNRLRRMVIYEDFHGADPDMPLAVTYPEIETSHALVEASLRLEHLAASFVSDASPFFDACQKWKIWPRLESLALTLNVMNPQEQSIKTNNLLEKAALVVKRMPRLQLMEIWNGGAGFAGLF